MEALLRLLFEDVAVDEFKNTLLNALNFQNWYTTIITTTTSSSSNNTVLYITF